MDESCESNGSLETMDVDGNADGSDMQLDDLLRDGIKDQLVAEEVVTQDKVGFLLPSRSGGSGLRNKYTLRYRLLHFADFLAFACLGKTDAYNVVVSK